MEEQYDYDVTQELWWQEQNEDEDWINAESIREKAYINHLIEEESKDEFNRERYGWW